MSSTFCFSLGDEQWEVVYENLPAGYHIIDLIPRNAEARKEKRKQMAAQRNRNILNRQPPLEEAMTFCHVCGEEPMGMIFKGEYYYCESCLKRYEDSPSICPKCGGQMSTDWDGPYCLNCNRHYHLIKPPTTA